jgi:hypothetical protein
MELDLIGGPVGAYLVGKGNPRGAQMNHPITIRRSTTGDAAAVARIAALDSARASRRRRIGLGRPLAPRPRTA